MISDEMRELLSAYVDGELRDADAARVEDLSKRDRELRREIEAYRKLRRKLREWDAAEHGVEPGPALKGRALARARSLEAERRAAKRGRILALVFHPASIAAAVLLAVGAGLFAARGAAPSAPAADVAEGGAGLDVPPLRPRDSLVLDGSALQPYEAPGAIVPSGPRLSDQLPSRRAVEFLKEQRREEARWERLKEQRLARPERRTVPPANLAVMAMIRGYAAVDEPWEGLVVVNHPQVVDVAAGAGAVPVGGRYGSDQHTSPARLVINLWRWRDRRPVLSPLGEVWTSRKDGTGRTRVVTASSWIKDTDPDFVPVVWADETAAPANRSDLEVQGFILGPRARRRLLSAAGKDEAFLAWMRDEYGGLDLRSVFARGVRERERKVELLVRALRDNPTATGFGVVDAEGRLLGVELFANHDLMAQFAARLLRGYLLEAGEKGIRLTRPKDGAARDLVALVLEGLPEKGVRLQGVDKGTGLGEGMRRVNLIGGPSRILGHGLLGPGDRPLHLTIFG